MMNENLTKFDDEFSITDEVINKIIELLDKNDINEAKKLLLQYGSFVQAMEILTLMLKK